MDSGVYSMEGGNIRMDQGMDNIAFSENVLRKSSAISNNIERLNKRDEQLKEARLIIERNAHNGKITLERLGNLFNDERFSLALFGLFTEEEDLDLEQSYWTNKLLDWAGEAGEDQVSKRRERLELVNLIEAITYVECQDAAVSHENFHNIFSKNKMVRKKLMNALCEAHEDVLEVAELMNFIMGATINPGSKLSKDAELRLKTVFFNQLGVNEKEIGIEEFKKIVPFKKDFFVKRMFRIFDKDNTGTISQEEFIETVQQFTKDDDDAKISFLFKLYDTNGNGQLVEEELHDVLKAMMTENGMEFEADELEHLANMLFKDGCKEGRDHLTLDDFKEQLQRREGLVKNLGIMINKWLVPPRPEKKKTSKEKFLEKLPTQLMTMEYWSNTLRIWILFIIAMNIAIMVQRVYYYRHFVTLNNGPNYFFFTSRATGKALLFNAIMVLVVVLRNAITYLRRLNLSSILPLDNNIYLHKVIGTIIFFLAAIHSLAHLSNFAVNIQPDPVKFVMLNYGYWTDRYGDDFVKLHKTAGLYRAPVGCNVTLCTDTSMQPKLEELSPRALNTSWYCQTCDSPDQMWSYAEWIFTDKPSFLGSINGSANLTGVAMMIILTIMFVCSLPFIRRRGHFEIFYYTHILYRAFFPILLIHSPTSWPWIAPIAALWILDKGLRFVTVFFGSGTTTIKAGVILPSKVTNLVIHRSPGFNFKVGDWVFVCIPAVAVNEWHPFTISSAPEVLDTFTLHIRSVGHWTTRLHELIKEEYAKQGTGIVRSESIYEGIRRTVSKRVQNWRKGSTNKSEEIFSDLVARKSGVPEIKAPSEVDMAKTVVSERKSFGETRYLSIKKPKTVKYEDCPEGKCTDVVVDNLKRKASSNKILNTPLKIYIDGPFGSPSSNIYRAEHAVLVGTGIGVTPFASILQSIMQRYLQIKTTCPNCELSWCNKMETVMFALKKVDFIWINRDQKSFEWFVNLLAQLEAQQKEHGGEMASFLEMHMYVTTALQRTDMKAVALQLALELLHEKEDRDLVTGLKARTHAGRPNWNKVFTKLREENKGQVTVFYCGNPILARVIKGKCAEFGFQFRKEVF